MISLKYIILIFCYSICVIGQYGPGSPDCPLNTTINSQKVPDPNDCTKYSECSQWFSAKKSCKKGQQFSPTKLECMDPCNAGCDPAYSCPNENDSEETTSSNGECNCNVNNN